MTIRSRQHSPPCAPGPPTIAAVSVYESQSGHRDTPSRLAVLSGWGPCWRHAARGAAVSTRMRNLLMGGLGELRHEPTGKRIRAVLGGGTVADTTRALLVWEPGRIVPSYAVPADDVAADLVPTAEAAAGAASAIGAR